MPEDTIINFPKIDGLTLTSDKQNIKDAISPIIGKGDYHYIYYAFYQGNKTRKVEFPEIKITSHGKEYKSSSFNIRVVDKVSIEKDDVILNLSLDKNQVKVGDKVTLTLELYTIFKNIYRADNYLKESNNNGEGNTKKVKKVIDMTKYRWCHCDH